MERTGQGYYNVESSIERIPISLAKTITTCKHVPIIAEIKKRSPASGILREQIDPAQVATAFKKGGAVGISVVTEPARFEGSLQFLRSIRETVDLPLLMKDIVTNEVQIEAASRLGADAILLIKAIFDRGNCQHSLQHMISFARSKGLEVLLESHNQEEFASALDTDVEMIGINNRNLRDLSVDLETAYSILENRKIDDRIVVVESGIQSRRDMDRFLKVGADAFLIGSSIMKAADIEVMLKEFSVTQ